MGFSKGHAYLGLIITSVVAASASTQTWRGHRAPASAHAYNIDSAASIYVTPRGQDYWSSTELRHILATNGIDLSQGHKDKWPWDADTTFNLNQLPAGLRPYQGTLNRLRDELKDWLPAAILRNPKFHVIARDLGYEANDLDLGVRVDGVWEHGIVLVAEARLPSLRAHAQDICGWDSSNPMFGSCKLLKDAWPKCLTVNKDHPERCDRYASGFGLSHPWVELADSQPLKISIPIRVGIRPEDGGLTLAPGVPSTNLDQLRFKSGQDWDLLLPTVQLEIDSTHGDGSHGKKNITVSPAPLETKLRGMESELVRLGLHHLQQFVIEQLPEEINNFALEKLSSGYSLVRDIGPAGSAPDDAVNFQWGLRPSEIGMLSELVYFKLAGFITDPENIIEVAPGPTAQRQPPQLKGMEITDYDFALAVNLDVINRIARLSYDRGYFDQVSAGKDSSGNTEYVKVVDGPPTFTPGPDGHGRLHLTIEMKRTGFSWPWELSQNWDATKEWWALKNPFRVALDLDVYLRASGGAPDAFEIVLDHIDTATSHVVPEDIDHSPEKIPAALKADLDQRNPGLAGTVISDPEKLPPSLFNLPFSALRFEVDPNGYFVFYMVYGDRYR